MPEKRRKKLLDTKTWERDGRLTEVATALRTALGDALFEDHNTFRDRVDAALNKAGTKLAAAELKLILKAVSWRVETAPPVIAKIHKLVHKPGKLAANPMLGLYDAVVAGKPCIVEYEPDADLRDTEQVPLLEEGGILAFIRREVLPYTPDAWVNNGATKIGYEISFTRHFYKPQHEAACYRRKRHLHTAVLAGRVPPAATEPAFRPCVLRQADSCDRVARIDGPNRAQPTKTLNSVERNAVAGSTLLQTQAGLSA